MARIATALLPMVAAGLFGLALALCSAGVWSCPLIHSAW